MERIDLAPASEDARLDAAVAWLAATNARDWTTIAPASEDASFRRYFRVTDASGLSAIVMDAPPSLENTQPFVNALELLASGNVVVPKLMANDAEQGFLLLQDLGRVTYLHAFHAFEQTSSAGDPTAVDALMQDAITMLVRLQKIDPAGAKTKIQNYDGAILRREIDLFPTWYLDRHLGIELSASEASGLERVYATLIASALSQPTVLCHRDYMPRNLMVNAIREQNPGVIDFQDAAIGPISYDIASLMRDAFVSWDEARVIDWTARYWDQARKARLPVRADFSEFYREVEWMGLQRHLKILGIFARINYRDGKPKYLGDAPRFVAYVRAAASRYEVFAPLLRLFDRIEQRERAVGYTF